VYGKGSVTYEGTILSDALQRAILQEILTGAGLAGPDQTLPPPVRTQHGTGNSGKALHYFLNYSGETQGFPYSYADGEDVLTGRPMARNATIALGPWDLAIIEER
jgi:beta-galactosidase